MFTASVQEECIKDVNYALTRAFRLFPCGFSVLAPPSLAGWWPVRFPRRHIDFPTISLQLHVCQTTCHEGGLHAVCRRPLLHHLLDVGWRVVKGAGTPNAAAISVGFRSTDCAGVYLVWLLSFLFFWPSVVCVLPRRQSSPFVRKKWKLLYNWGDRIPRGGGGGGGGRCHDLCVDVLSTCKADAIHP